MPSQRKKNDERIDMVMEWTKTGLEWGQKITSVVPVPAYDLVSEALLALIEQVVVARTNKRAAATVLENIQTLANIIGRSRGELESRITSLSASPTEEEEIRTDLQDKPQFEDPFNKFIRDLRHLKDLSKELNHKWGWLRFVFAKEDAKIIKDIEDGVSRATKFFEMRCEVATQEYLQGITNRLAEIHSAIKRIEEEAKKAEIAAKKKEDDKFLESMPHAEASYRVSKNAETSELLEGTRTTLFEELDRWIEGDLSDKPVCVLLGAAGVGKSTVASELCKRLEEKDGKLGASFFFTRDLTNLNSTRLFFPTIAYQLANWTKGALRQPVIDAAQTHFRQGTTQAMIHEARALLHAPLECTNKDRAIFVVIDALDECTQEASEMVPRMLDLLINATEHGPLRIFLTSRPELFILDKLQTLQWANSIHTMSLDTLSAEANEDVAKYIESRFRQIARSTELFGRQPDVATRLTDQAQGLFIYARIAMDFLNTYCGTLDEGIELLLSVKSGQYALNRLDQLYLIVLTNAFPPHTLVHPPLFKRVQFILGSIAYGMVTEPQAIEGLTSLTSAPITCQEMYSVLEHLRSVVIFNCDDLYEPFRPIHATFPQFLVDNTRCTNELYLVDLRHYHARLAHACLTTVLSLNEGICRLEQPMELLSSGPNAASNNDRSAILRQKNINDVEHMLLPSPIPRHIYYACCIWSSHLLQACKPGEHQDNECFCGNLVDLLRRLARDWDNLRRMEIISIIAVRPPELGSPFEDACAWLPSDSQYDALRSELQDAKEAAFHPSDLDLLHPDVRSLAADPTFEDVLRGFAVAAKRKKNTSV